jgi:hypothetical protein
MIWRAMTEESGRVLERAQQVRDEDEAPEINGVTHIVIQNTRQS